MCTHVCTCARMHYFGRCQTMKINFIFKVYIFNFLKIEWGEEGTEIDIFFWFTPQITATFWGWTRLKPGARNSMQIS